MAGSAAGKKPPSQNCLDVVNVSVETGREL